MGRAEAGKLGAAKHGPGTARLHALEQEIKRREARLRERAIEQAIARPPDYITRVLGERPLEPERRAVWDHAARRIERRASGGSGAKGPELGL